MPVRVVASAPNWSSWEAHTAPKTTTIDAYLASVKGEKRAALEALRKTIRTVVPDAEECISNAMPAFRLRRKVVAGFAGVNCSGAHRRALYSLT